jgi:4'-phosphopantetheinyl transferase
MDVHWSEQTAAEVPADNDWLGAREAVRLSGMRFAKRRADWRLGRWTAKHAVAAYLNLPSLAGMEILPAPSGAPEVFLGNDRAPVTISISHREGVAVCAVAGPYVALGCDLEIVEPRSEAFAIDYFTAAEQALVAEARESDRPRIMALLWSGKESVLKAMRVGLRLDTRSVSIDPVDALLPDAESQWRPLHARHEARVFDGWWQQTGPLVRTLVAGGRAELPAPVCPAWAESSEMKGSRRS